MNAISHIKRGNMKATWRKLDKKPENLSDEDYKESFEVIRALRYIVGGGYRSPEQRLWASALLSRWEYAQRERTCDHVEVSEIRQCRMRLTGSSPDLYDELFHTCTAAGLNEKMAISMFRNLVAGIPDGVTRHRVEAKQ